MPMLPKAQPAGPSWVRLDTTEKQAGQLARNRTAGASPGTPVSWLWAGSSGRKAGRGSEPNSDFPFADDSRVPRFRVHPAYFRGGVALPRDRAFRLRWRVLRVRKPGAVRQGEERTLHADRGSCSAVGPSFDREAKVIVEILVDGKSIGQGSKDKIDAEERKTKPFRFAFRLTPEASRLLEASRNTVVRVTLFVWEA